MNPAFCIGIRVRLRHFQGARVAGAVTTARSQARGRARLGGFAECRVAFGWDLDTYLFYGGYPGSAPLVGDFDRWRRYIVDALIETTVSRDVLALTRVDKPALLRRLFYLACEYSGQIVAYTKLLGQLHDAGNTTTLAHYLDLLGSAWLVAGL